MITNLGCSGGAKWFDSSCVPKECMVVENRFELYHKADQANFWDIFVFARDNGIKQIITIDNYIDRDSHYYPSETELRRVVQGIKKALIDNRISKDMACFQLDNEPAKHKVPVATYCGYANIIHSELAGDYDLYVGGEEVSYRDFYEYVVANSNCEGIAFHLQNCALDVNKTDDSINFINALAQKYQKIVTCSEGNYLDPSKEYAWNMINYHIKRCRDIGATDYCVIFLALKNADKYRWLSFKYNNVVRSQFYDDYINLCLAEKNKPIEKEIEDMKLSLLGLKYTKEGQQVKWLQDILLNDYGVPNPYGIDGKLGKATDKQIRDYQEEYGLKIDGIVGEQTTMKLINESSDPKMWMRNLQIYMAYE